MKAVIQRVREAAVIVDGRTIASIGTGLVILLGIRKGDRKEAAESLADKCASLRVFDDGEGKMNLGLRDVGGKVIVVSQFTLYADTQRGNRPGFTEAARPEEAEPLYELFVGRLRAALGEERVLTGVFRSVMDVKIVNEGPVTILMERDDAP